MSAWGKGGTAAAASIKAPPKPTSSLAAAMASAGPAKPKASIDHKQQSTSSSSGRGTGSASRGGTGRGGAASGGRGAGGRGGGHSSSSLHAGAKEKHGHKQDKQHHGNALHSAMSTGGSGNTSKKRPQQKAHFEKDSSSNNNKSTKPPRPSTKSLEEIELLTNNADSGSVIRIDQSQFLACRKLYLQAPLVMDEAEDGAADDKKNQTSDSTTANGDVQYWTPHPLGLWTSPDRADRIRDDMDRLFHVQPLEINDTTRWKPKRVKAATTNGSESTNAATSDGGISEAEEEQLRQAFAILNKLSWTTLDKLTVAFLEALGVSNNGKSPSSSSSSDPDKPVASLSIEVVTKVMGLLVEKAMLEAHFAELYARFADKLAKVHKAFKRTLLKLCQELFEEQDATTAAAAAGSGTTTATNTLTPAADATVSNGAADARDKEFEEILARKKSIGLMHFIGELYHVGLIKGTIMIACLQRLLQPDDEERLDCFCKLMTTIGSRLHDDNTEQDKDMMSVWRQVYVMAGRVPPAELGQDDELAKRTDLKAPSVRVRFLLQDLIELKENNWVHRRKQEKAKSIKEIHKEVAQEEAAQRRITHQSSVSIGSNNVGMRKSTSFTRSQSTSSVEPADEDGFVSVAKPKKNAARVAKTQPQASSSSGGPKTSLQMAVEGKSNKSKNGKTGSVASTPRASADLPRAVSPLSPTLTSSPVSKIQEHLDPEECAKRGKSLFKEFFVGGDLDEAVLTVDEIVCTGAPGHVERGAAMIKAATFMVLEMKQEDCDKFKKVVEQCIQQEKISAESLITGVQDPMESLRDIEIDAPLAAKIMASILASWVGLGAVPLDMLRSCPDYFLTDGRPADFACMVLAKRGGPVSDSDAAVVEALMHDDEKAAHPSINDWIASFQA